MTIIILQSECVWFLFIFNYSFLGLRVRSGLVSAFAPRAFFVGLGLARLGALLALRTAKGCLWSSPPAVRGLDAARWTGHAAGIRR